MIIKLNQENYRWCKQQTENLIFKLCLYENQLWTAAGLTPPNNTMLDVQNTLKYLVRFNHFWICMKENRVVGTVGFDGESLVCFYVEEQFRSQGIGEALFQAVDESCDIVNLVTLPSNRAVNFYKRKGFEFVSDYVMVRSVETRGES